MKEFAIRIALIVLVGVAIAWMLAGCAHDNGIVYKPAPKPAPADTITAVGNVLGGAWDRLRGTK